MAEKKKRGFLSKLGFKSKEEKLAIEAAERAAKQKQVDEQMAARMAAINAAALASARQQDAAAKEISAEEQAAIEAEEKRQAEIQAARDVERAKQLAEEKARREQAEAEEAARLAEEKRLAEERANQEAEAVKRRAAEAKARAEDEARREAERQAEIARAKSEAEAAELKRKAEEEAAARALAEKERLEREAAEAEARRLAEEEAAAKRAEEARLKRLADEAAEAERRAKRAADRKAREQAEEAERERLAEERRQQRIEAGLSPEPEPEHEVTGEGNFLDRITKGLRKSTSRMSDSLSATFNQRTLDAEALEDLEDILIMSDMGSDVAAKVSESLAEDKFSKTVTDLEIKVALAETISDILTPLETPFVLGLARPQVILFVGVNGSGKTTTLGKIAKRFNDQGKRVLICAADTFRAAAVEQLTVWGERAGAPVMHGKPGADAAGLVFDAMKRATDEDFDVLMIDTAGRLQNRTELMDELAKIIRVIEKYDASAPHHSVLVLDATVGQNALSQVEAFREAGKVSGLIMTKLDGTAKGGVLVALSEKYKLPIHFIGIGERIEDLETFSAPVFAAALSGVADTLQNQAAE